MSFRMGNGFAHLKTRITVTEKPVRCQTCGDSGHIVVEVGKTFDGQPKTETQPCPDCTNVCATCGNRGFIRYSVPIDDPRFGKLYPCPNPYCPTTTAARESKKVAMRKFTELPGEYARFTFESFQTLGNEALAGKWEALYAARQFVDAINVGGWVNMADLATMFGYEAEDDARNWIGFWGEPGYGKTGLAAAIINALTERDNPVQCLYIRFGDLVEAIQSRYSAEARRAGMDDDFGGMTSEQVLDRVRTVKVLVLDEFDVPDVTQNKISLMQKLINHRYMHRMPTVFTTNLRPDQYSTRWASDVGSRLKDRTHWFKLSGANLRNPFSVVGE